MTDFDAQLAEKRHALGVALRETQEGVRRTFGVRTAKKSWLLPLLAAGVGMTLAIALRRRRSQS